jgi:hypothetical protein
MDEGSRKAIQEEIERLSGKKLNRGKQWKALEVISNSFQEETAEPDKEWRVASYDIVRRKLTEFLEARTEYYMDSMRDMSALLGCIEILLKEKLEPEDRVKFELFEGLVIGWRDNDEDGLLGNVLNHLLVGFILSLVDESNQLEPIRKGVGVLVPAMQQFREKLKEAREQENQANRVKEEWMKRHSTPKGAVFT